MAILLNFDQVLLAQILHIKIYIYSIMLKIIVLKKVWKVTMGMRLPLVTSRGISFPNQWTCFGGAEIENPSVNDNSNYNSNISIQV